MDQHLIEKGMILILEGLGVNRRDRNFQDTPERYARALKEMFEPPELDLPMFDEQYTDFALLRDHRLYSMCPHHMLPVKLFVSVAYIPNGKVLGLSKLARLANECNRGPILQEAFTKSIVDFLSCRLHVRGAACLVEGKHGCMEMRGIRSDAHFFTTKFTGEFEENTRLQDRFINLCKTPHL